MSATPSHFTAAQLSRALGKEKRSVQLALADNTPIKLPVQGGEANAWPLDSLPNPWRVQLAAEAQRRGCRDAAHLLHTLLKPWQPEDRDGRPLKLDQVDRRALERAAQLREALKRPLATQHDITPAQLRELGLEEFARVSRTADGPHLRKQVGAKQWARLFDRTIDRDRGAEDWDRIEIYLDEDAFLRPVPIPTRAKARFTFSQLDVVIKNLEDKRCPTADDRDWLFHKAFTSYEHLTAQHPDAADHRAIKSSLLDYLARNIIPSISKTAKALGKLFDRRLQKWRKGGRTMSAMTDGRPLASGNFRRPDFTKDEREIAKLAVLLDGNIAGARRLAEDQGKLSPEYCSYDRLDRRRNKSSVSKATRRLAPLVNATVFERRGPDATREAGPHVTRDWSAEKPGDCFVFDDVTWNHYFKYRGADGKWYITRGECLVATDEKSDYPLDFLLIAGHYNGLHIRQLFAQVETSVGLPRKGITLEYGRWDSNIVTGNKRKGWQPLHLRHFKNGLSDPRLNLKIGQATSARAKTIESFFGRMEERMRVLPGFVGFNERLEKMERMQPIIARAHRGDEEALSQFRTQEQWKDDIRKAMDDFIHDPGNGDRLRGETPAEAWNRSLLGSTLRKLSEDTRHLLASHENIVRLHPTKGVVLRIPGRKVPVCYVNEHTAALMERGEKWVRVLMDLEHPELISCFAMKGTHRFTVKGQMAPAKDATRKHLADLAQLRAAHRAPSKALFGEIQHEVRSNIVRDDDQDEQTKEEGRFTAAAREAYKAEESEDKKRLREARRLCDALGKPMKDPNDIRSMDQYLTGLRLQLQIKERQNTPTEGTAV